MTDFNYEAACRERDALYEIMGKQVFDPLSDEYREVFKAAQALDRTCLDYAKAENERLRIATDNDKIKGDDKVAKIQFWSAVIPSTITVIGTIAKAIIGSKTIERTTRESYGLDQNKMISRQAADVSKNWFSKFF